MKICSINTIQKLGIPIDYGNPIIAFTMPE